MSADSAKNNLGDRGLGEQKNISKFYKKFVKSFNLLAIYMTFEGYEYK
jgi:hypothetical protein